MEAKVKELEVAVSDIRRDVRESAKVFENAFGKEEEILENLNTLGVGEEETESDFVYIGDK